MEFLALAMFPALLILIFVGLPVAFALMITSIGFGFISFGTNLVHLLTDKVNEVSGNFILAAVPLFIFMGCMLERSRIAEQLFEAMHVWTKRLPGGLAIGTVLMGLVFAATTGVIGAAETVIGMLAIPPMLKHGYDKRLISGTICAGGSLGTITPPSVVAVVIASLANVSVGALFVAIIVPGLILAASYVLYILVICTIKPQYGPRIPPGPDDPTFMEKIRLTMYALVPPLLMVIAVLGSLITGLAAPTEAAGLGALCSIFLTLFYRRFSFAILYDSLLTTVRITSMILLILLGGSMFSGVFTGTGGLTLIQNLVQTMEFGQWALLFLALGLAFFVGFFLEWASVTLIFIPIFAPLMQAAGIDVIWFCVLFMIMLQTGYLTPPLAIAIFYLRGISPPEITLAHMYKGVIPFVFIQLGIAGLIILFPALALWLPTVLLGK